MLSTLTLSKVLPKLASSSAIMSLMRISFCFSSGKTSPITLTTTFTSLNSTKAFNFPMAIRFVLKEQRHEGERDVVLHDKLLDATIPKIENNHKN